MPSQQSSSSFTFSVTNIDWLHGMPDSGFMNQLMGIALCLGKPSQWGVENFTNIVYGCPGRPLYIFFFLPKPIFLDWGSFGLVMACCMIGMILS